MSVYFTFDTNLIKIEKESKLEKLDTSRFYRIYGLKYDSNPPILIGYRDLPNGKTEKQIRKLLSANGIPVEFTKEKTDTISIGLRIDLREHVFLAAAAMNCVIGYLENKLNLDKEYLFGLKRINPNFIKKTIDFSAISD